MNCSLRDLAHTLPGREGEIINRPFLNVFFWTDIMLCEVTIQDVDTGELGKVFCEEEGLDSWSGILSGVFRIVDVKKTLRCFM